MPAVDVTRLATHLMDAAEQAGVRCWTVMVEEREAPAVAVVTWWLYARGVVSVAAETHYPTKDEGVEALTKAMLGRIGAP